MSIAAQNQCSMDFRLESGTGHKVQEGVGWKKSGGGPSFSCMKKVVGQKESCNTLGVGHE